MACTRPSEVIDPAAYRWTDTDWHGRPWEEMVIYELHVGAFSADGTFAGAMPHLDELVELGVTAIELMPVAAFPGERNWGYDGVQLFAPAASYGRPEDLKALVEACHARGLAVLLDVVYNHFGPEGNYLHVVARDFFTQRHHTPWGAAINYDDESARPVREFMLHNALYWLEEFHFDGLRLDAVHAIVDDSEPDIVTEIAATIRQRIADRDIHLVLENDHNEARRLVRSDGRPVGHNAQWNDDLHHALHVLVTGQTGGYYSDYADRPIAHLGRALAEGFAYQGEPSPYREGRATGRALGRTAGHRLRVVPAEPRPDRQHAVRRAHRRPRPRGAAPCRGRDRAAVAAGAAVVHGRGMGERPALPVLLRFRAAAGRGGAPGSAARVRPVSRVRRGGGAGPAARSDRRDEPRGVSPRSGGAQRQPHAGWLERYRRLLALRARAIVPRLRGMAPGGQLPAARAGGAARRLAPGRRLDPAAAGQFRRQRR